MGDLVVRGLVQVWLVGAIIFVSMTVRGPWGGSVSTSAGQSVQVSGLGVLDLWGFNWDSVVDDWNVLGSVPCSGSEVGWRNWGVQWSWTMARVSGNLGVSGSVESLGVLNFWGFDWDTVVDLWDVDGSVPLLCWAIMSWAPMVMGWRSMSGNVSVGSEVSSLGSSHFRGIGRNVRSGADRSQQQH